MGVVDEVNTTHKGYGEGHARSCYYGVLLYWLTTLAVPGAVQYAGCPPRDQGKAGQSHPAGGRPRALCMCRNVPFPELGMASV
jgi:hypothetical protein